MCCLIIPLVLKGVGCLISTQIPQTHRVGRSTDNWVRAVFTVDVQVKTPLYSFDIFLHLRK